MRRLNAIPVFTVLGLAAAAPWRAPAQEPAGDEVVKMEPFNVTAYRGRIPIVDGFTGKEYRGSNDVVFNFAQSFNQLLVGYHRKLVLDEVKHLQFRLRLGREFEKELGQLFAAFGFGRFTLDSSTWLRRERAIITRLMREPFFKIKALVVWDIERLQQGAPAKPENKYARDLRFNTETGRWERRITASWEVFFQNNRNPFGTEKLQGLNLDTQQGFHFIERGLPVNVPPSAFREVSLTYPIFYSDNRVDEPEVRRLQENFIANLHYIYDPFSWVARRDTRFRGGFQQEALEHVNAQRIFVGDREWFDPVLARFLSDVVTIKLQGADEIYALYMVGKRLGESPRALGSGLDLLNWNKGEKRQAPDRPEAPPRIAPGHPGGFRFVLIDAHQRFGDAFVERIRTGLLAQKEKRERIDGRTMLTQIIEEMAGVPYAGFVAQAKATQEAHLARHRLTRKQEP